MKAYYPPNYDREKGHMEKFPRIQRFNEDFADTLSNAASQRKYETLKPKSDFSNILNKVKSQMNFRPFNTMYQSVDKPIQDDKN